MTYAGFDRADLPPLDMMARLKKETNLTWCGYYLHAPSQAATTWRGKRAALVAQGWGLAPIFVGQQITGPGSHNVTSTQGSADGERACEEMKSEGFPSGSWVYLDLENGPPFTAVQKGYVGAWVDAVEKGGYRAGVYCSYLFAAEVKALRPSVRIWVFHVPSTKAHEVNGTQFPSPPPSTSGYAKADLWQREDEARLTLFGNLSCDLNTSNFADPSAPEKPVQAEVAPPAVPVAPVTPLPPVAVSTPTFWQRVAAWFKRAA